MNANRMTFAAATAAALLGSWGTAPQLTITPICTIETEGPPTNGYFPHTDWRGVPLHEAVEKGLQFLVASQGKNGGYGQDGRDPRAAVGMACSSQGSRLSG